MANGAGGRIARVGKARLPCALAFVVDTGEFSPVEINLPAHFDECGMSISEHAQGDGSNRSEVLCDVFAGEAIATGGTSSEDAILVGQGYCKSIDFQLGEVVDDFVLGETEMAFHAFVEGGQFLFIEGVAEAQHRKSVLNGLELAQRRRSNTLGGRI